MNKDTKCMNDSKRQTRSNFINEDDKKVFNVNYIDKFYSKKKKSSYIGNINFLLFENIDNEKCNTVAFNNNAVGDEKTGPDAFQPPVPYCNLFIYLSAPRESEKTKSAPEQHYDSSCIIDEKIKINKKQYNTKIQIEKNKDSGVKEKKPGNLSKNSQKYFNIKKEDILSESKNLTNFDATLALVESEREQTTLSVKSSKIFSVENGNSKMHNSRKTKNKFNLQDHNKDELLDWYKEVRDIKLLGRKTVVRREEEEVKKLAHGDIDLKRVEFRPETDWLIRHSNSMGKLFRGTLFNPELRPNLPSQNEKETVTKELEHCSNVPNPFDAHFRLNEANRLNFIRNFQEDYAPIKMQKDNEKLFESNVNGDAFTKTHFIKKKQSACNIKRQSGVSYVIETESKQLYVDKSYKPLGHLVYQGTHSVQQLTDENIINHINTIITEDLLKGPLLISVFESPDEDEMKQYLLKPAERFKLTRE
jgi:hypothetical protein